jgi:predicted CXXCH cytochrome family protein
LSRKQTLVLVACCSVVLALGCSYKTLKFFFDGVPEPKQKTQAATPGAVHAQAEQGGPRFALYQHAPYAAKECDSCHDRNRTNSLIVPKDQLCYNCHDFPLDKKYVHGPLVSGGCLLCHNPHSSPNPFLLVSAPNVFCFNCHDRDAIPRDEPHTRTDVQCTFCHDAHMSVKKYLLK